MAADREAELKIKATLDAEQAVQGAEKLGSSIEKIGGAAGETAANTSKAASAFDDAGSSASIAGQKTAAAAQGATQATEAVTVAAQEERAAIASAGDQASQSGTEASKAMETVAAAEQGAAGAADQLRGKVAAVGDTAAAATNETAQGFEKVGAQIRNSGLALEVQRAGLVAVIDQAEQLTNAYIAQGEAGANDANAMGEALLKLRARLADVNADIRKHVEELRNAGNEGPKAFDQIAGAALTFDSVAEGAFNRVNAAYKILGEEFILTPRQLGKLSQAVELLKLQMVEQAEKGIAVTAEEIATYERLEGELTKLTLTANKLTNAQKDNAVRLKETGNQIQGVAFGVQQLTSMLGPNAAKVGMLVGNVGQLAGAAESMKDSVKAMNLNTLDANASMATMGTQAGLVAAALAAGAYAGGKFAAQNKENTSAVDSYIAALKKWLSVDVADWIDGANLSAQKATTEGFAGYLKWLTGIAFVAHESGSEIRFQTAAIRDGIPAQQAAAIAAKAGAEGWKFYEESVKGGAQGHELWLKALRESSGDGMRFVEIIRQLGDAMKSAVTFEEMAAKSRKQTEESTKQAAQEIAYLSKNLDSVGWRSDEIAVYSADIADLSTKIKGLNEDERARLVLISDLLAKGPDITGMQKELLQTLLEQAAAGTAASAVQNTLIRSYLDLDIAVDGASKKLGDARTVLEALSEDWDKNRERVHDAVDAMQEALDKTDNLSDAQRRQYQQEINLARAKEAELERFAQLDEARAARSVEDEQRTQRAIHERMAELSRLMEGSRQYAAQIEQIGGELADLTAHTARLSGAERERLGIISDLSSRASTLTAAERGIAQALIAEVAAGRQATAAMNDLAKAKLAVAATDEGLVIALSGTTDAINTDLVAITELIDKNEAHSVQLQRLADLLNADTAAAEGLTKAERDRIEAVIELAKRGDELTETEKRYVKALAESIQHGNYQVNTLEQLNAAEKKRTDSVQNEIDITRALIEEKERALGLDKKDAEQNMLAGASVEYLRMREKQLTEELKPQLYVIKGVAAARDEDNEARKKLSETIDREKIATDNSKTAQGQLATAIDTTRTAYGNLTEAQNTNADSAGKVADAHKKVATNADDAAASMAKLKGSIPEVTGLMSSLESLADRVAKALKKVKDGVDDLDAAAAKAASGSTPANVH